MTNSTDTDDKATTAKREKRKPIPYNEQAVRKVAKAEHAKQTEYKIDDVPGLVLTVMPSGGATYAVRYSFKGKQTRKTIGDFGSTTLADARAKALKVAAGLPDDVDVLAREKKDKNRMTLRAMWEARLANDGRRAPGTMEDYGRILANDIFPTLGDKFADDITPDDFADVLRKIEDRSERVASITRAALSGTYRWAIGKRLIARNENPIKALGFHHQSKPRERVLTDEEMQRVWRAITTTDGLTGPMRNILRLAILTGQRNSEVAGMEVSELIGMDTATPRWKIPGVRMKRKNQDQNVPLSKQAVEIINSATGQGGSSNGHHVFQGAVKGRRDGVWRQGHIGQESVSRAMTKVREAAKVEDINLHDMRKCITTWLAEHDHALPHVLDAILHHGKKGVTGSHYNFALYEREVRKALQVWADHVEALGAAVPTAAKNVVALKKGAA